MILFFFLWSVCMIFVPHLLVECMNDWQIVVLCEPVLTGTEGDQVPRSPAIHRVHCCTQRWSHEGHVRAVQAARGSQQPTKQQGQSNSQGILFVLINTAAIVFEFFSLSRPWFKAIISPSFLLYLFHLLFLCADFWNFILSGRVRKGVISKSFYYILVFNDRTWTWT